MKLLRYAERFLDRLKGAHLENVTLGHRVLPHDGHPVVGSHPRYTARIAPFASLASSSGPPLSPVYRQSHHLRAQRNCANCRIQPAMVWSGISTPKRLKIFACRCTGKWSAILLTITCASRMHLPLSSPWAAAVGARGRAAG